MSYLHPVFPLLLILSLVTAFLRKPTSRRFHFLSILSITAVFLWTWPPVAWLLSGSLEWWYPHSPAVQEPEAIVILSGGVEAPEVGLNPRLGHGSAARCAYGARLHRRWKRIPIVVTGDRAITDLMRTQLTALGVPEEMIWTEPLSSSTWDHASHCARLLSEKRIRRIALVTEAYHMLRSEACFRKQGFDVQAAPCAFRTLAFSGTISDWLPGADAIRSNEEIAHEWVGLAYYWLRRRV